MSEMDTKQLTIKDSSLQRLVLPIIDGLRLIDVSEILYCEANDNYTNVITKDENILISKTLKWIESQLPENTFFRIHKSVLVNLFYISFLSLKNEYTVTLINNKTFPIAYRRKTELENTIRKKFSNRGSK